MISRLIKTALVACLVIAGSKAVFADQESVWISDSVFPSYAEFALPTTPPGMVPMVVYVPAQQMQAPIPPHTHAPQAAQTIEATHCAINDVAVLTKDPSSCKKAGGTVVVERAAFDFSFDDCRHKENFKAMCGW